MSRNWKEAPMSAADKAVYAVMQDMPLQPGQMLLLGPQSVKILSTPGAFAGKLPDKVIIDKSEWNITAQPKRRKANAGR